jgi:hypothetical protein
MPTEIIDLSSTETPNGDAVVPADNDYIITEDEKQADDSAPPTDYEKLQAKHEKALKRIAELNDVIVNISKLANSIAEIAATDVSKEIKILREMVDTVNGLGKRPRDESTDYIS